MSRRIRAVNAVLPLSMAWRSIAGYISSAKRLCADESMHTCHQLQPNAVIMSSAEALKRDNARVH